MHIHTHKHTDERSSVGSMLHVKFLSCNYNMCVDYTTNKDINLDTKVIWQSFFPEVFGPCSQDVSEQTYKMM